MLLILLRHCTTPWNRVERLQGQTDIELDEGGVKEAQVLGERMEGLGIQRIFTSDLKRAALTAAWVNMTLRVPVIPDHRLRECSFGSLEGKTRAELCAQDARETAPWSLKSMGAYDFSPYGGESREKVIARQLALLAEIQNMREATQGPVLLVGHGRSLNTLLDHFGHPAGIVRNEWREIST